MLADLVRTRGEGHQSATNERTHFFGSVVTKNLGHGAGAAIQQHEVIDGQQRLTTTSVLLATLRTFVSPGRVKLIDELIKNDREGEAAYKLQLNERDQPIYEAIVDGNEFDEKSPLGHCASFFRRELAKLDNHDDLLETVRHQLLIIEIVLLQSDDTHRIFQTLNSTGRALNASDLIRNHFFMLLDDPSYRAYEKYWKPMEERLEGSLDRFFWVYLTAFVDHTVSTKVVYEKMANDVLAPIENDKKLVERKMKELAECAVLYAQIISPSTVQGKTKQKVQRRGVLERNREWGTNHHEPLLLLLLQRVEDGELKEEEFEEACRVTESFLVRRLFADLRTNNLNRYFTSIVGAVRKSSGPSLKALKDEIRRDTYEFPTDDEVKLSGSSLNFYGAQRSSQRQFILRRIEEHISGKEKVKWTPEFTVEHILPQTLPAPWLKNFSSTEEAQELLHNLGNLTLTAYNSELSYHPHERKKEIYRDSALRMNQQLSVEPNWGTSEIRSRCAELLELACEIWPSYGPRVATTDVEVLPKVEDAVSVLEAGQWVTADDVADALGLPVERVLRALSESTSGIALPILAEDGQPARLTGLERLNFNDFVSQLAERGVFDMTSEPLAAPAGSRRALLE